MGRSILDENEDRFSEHGDEKDSMESTYEIKVKMEQEENNMNMNNSKEEDEEDEKKLNFSVHINTKSKSNHSMSNRTGDEKEVNVTREKENKTILSKLKERDHNKMEQSLPIEDNDNDNDNISEKSNKNKKEEVDSEADDKSDFEGSDSEDSENANKKIEARPNEDEGRFDDILDYYAYLRGIHNANNPWEDPEFPCDINLFGKDGEYPERFQERDYAIEFVRLEDESDDNHFFSTERSTNIEYQFNLKRGIMNDKFFIGSVLMLFRKKEQFLTNLVLDYPNIQENLRAGFCGFSFFINGEWRNVTIDTNLPWYQADEMALSIATSNKTSFWLCLLQKAYSKIHKTYDVLNDVSVKNTLVDLTGGISKKITIKEKLDDSDKKYLFDEIRRCIQNKYLVGSMKFDLTVENVNLY